jgi:hypothetical protein
MCFSTGDINMASNSKLNPDQKAARKAWLADLPINSTMITSGCGITILAVPDGNVTRFYSSVSSPDEVKIRRKVGEYHALARWSDGMGDGFFLPGSWTAEEMLEQLAR